MIDILPIFRRRYNIHILSASPFFIADASKCVAADDDNDAIGVGTRLSQFTAEYVGLSIL